MGGAHRGPRRARLSIVVGTAALTLAATTAPAASAATTGNPATAPVVGLGSPSEGAATARLGVAGGAPGVRVRPATDPVLARIARESAAAEALAEELSDAQVKLSSLQATYDRAAAAVTDAAVKTAGARAGAEAWARASFIAEAVRPRSLVTDPRSAMLGQPGVPTIGTAAIDLDVARAREQLRGEVAAHAAEEVQSQSVLIDALRRNLAARSATIRRLRAARASALIELNREKDAANAALAKKYLRDADGSAAKAALTAVGYALDQRGKPYEWGAEGPDRFDCSGLVQMAYKAADVSVPRTARPQYRASVPVSVTALLPGDLLFFATDRSDWNTIHHVGVYLGRGLMVHAPTEGDVVRVAPVWWSEFFAAGRVVPGRLDGRRSTLPYASALRPDRPRATHREGSSARRAKAPRTEAQPKPEAPPRSAGRPESGQRGKSAGRAGEPVEPSTPRDPAAPTEPRTPVTAARGR
ncbi:C40 family peptidase [Cryptosporangium phraense]|uniref:NlpC/P60 domain-containing protein n=1 Tax=Cryptosporangium phraense TaxID=2593070 RepID=A0A545AU71_9ACTN|nr:C40 family peptidase [Cryptosporangium phraense]TQS44899.1 hypothetical protein FL583_10290 [Cryptosporangium phraense]